MMQQTFLVIVLVLFAAFISSKTSFAQTDNGRNATDSIIEEEYNDSISYPMFWHAPVQRIWDEDSIAALRANKSYAYMQWIDSLLKARNKEISTSSEAASGNHFDFEKIINIILLTIAVLLLGYLIYRFSVGKNGMLKKHKSFSAQKEIDELEENEPIDAFTLQEAITNTNYKKAIRILYINMLDHLHANGYINKLPNKTNYQYLQEIKDRGIMDETARLMMYFEYVWYGHFVPSQQQFVKIYDSYQNFLKR